MKVKALSYVCAAICLLACAAGFAQTRATPTRYYTSTYGTPMGGHYVGHVHGGDCEGCGVSGPGCGCEMPCGGPRFCHGCHHCCPRILPAVARGVGAVADFVGCTLDVIFCRPGGCGGCGPRACCVRRPMCGCGPVCGGDCCDGGFDSYGPGEVMGEPMGEPIPAAPPVPAEARAYRSRSMTRAIVAPKAQVARKSPAVKRQTYSTTPASAEVEVTKRTPQAPRELVVDDQAVALNPFGDEPAPSIQRTTNKAPSRSLPNNPLR